MFSCLPICLCVFLSVWRDNGVHGTPYKLALCYMLHAYVLSNTNTT